MKKKQIVIGSIVGCVSIFVLSFFLYRKYQNQIASEKYYNASQIQDETKKLQAFEDILQNYPKAKIATTVRLRIANIYIGSKKYKDALRYLHACKSRDKSIQYIKYAQIGHCKTQLCDFEGALAVFQKAAKADDNPPPANYIDRIKAYDAIKNRKETTSKERKKITKKQSLIARKGYNSFKNDVFPKNDAFTEELNQLRNYVEEFDEN